MARKYYVDVVGAIGSGGLTNSATSHTFTVPLTYANGITLPTLATGDSFLLSIKDPNTARVTEVVEVTAYNQSTGVSTIVRGKEGTPGVAHTAGDKVILSAYPSDLTGGGSMKYAAAWAAGTYPKGSVVTYQGRTWVADVDTSATPTLPTADYAQTFAAGLPANNGNPWTFVGANVVVGPSNAFAGTAGTGGATNALRMSQGPAPLGRYADLAVTYLSAGTITFADAVYSEGGWDIGHFFIDGVEQHTATGGPTNWTARSYPVAVGAHTFRWSYTNDGSGAVGLDTYAVTNILCTGTGTGATVPWQPIAAGTLDALNDVDTSTAPPSAVYQGLVWDGIGWVPSPVSIVRRSALGNATVSYSTFGTTGTPTWTPTGVAVGDVGILVVAGNSAGPAGWDLLYSQDNLVGFYGGPSRVYTKVLTSSDLGATTAGAGATRWTVHVIRGLDVAPGAGDRAITVATTTPVGTFTLPAITATSTVPKFVFVTGVSQSTTGLDPITFPAATIAPQGQRLGSDASIRSGLITENTAATSSTFTASGNRFDYALVVVTLDTSATTPIAPADVLNDLSDVAISSPANKQALVYDAASGQWQNASIGYQFPIDKPPTTPHAKDDEFTGTTLNAKWTNPITTASGTTVTLNDTGVLLLESSTAGSSGITQAPGIRQDSPTGAFTVTAKLAPGVHGDDCTAGLFVARTAASKQWFLGAQRSFTRWQSWQGGYSESAGWGGYDGNGFDSTQEGYTYDWAYFRIVHTTASAGTVIFQISAHGNRWLTMGTRTGTGQMDRFGLAIWGNSVSADHDLFCDWFRVTEP